MDKDRTLAGLLHQCGRAAQVIDSQHRVKRDDVKIARMAHDGRMAYATKRCALPTEA